MSTLHIFKDPDMKLDPFYSKFFLNFKDPAMNTYYNKRMGQVILIKLAWIGNFILSLINLVWILHLSDSQQGKFDTYFVAFNFALKGVGTVLILFLVKIDTITRRGIVILICKVTLTINLIIISNTLSNNFKEHEELFHFTFLFLDILIKSLWLLISAHSFTYASISSISSFGFIVLIFSLCDFKWKTYPYAFVFFYLGFSLMFVYKSYLLEKLRKENFYYKENLIMKTNKLRELIELMNCGFVEIRMNPSFNYLKSISRCIITHLNNFFSLEAKYFDPLDMDVLVNNCKDTHIDDENSLRLINFIFSSDLNDLNTKDLDMKKDVMVNIQQTVQCQDNFNESRDLIMDNHTSSQKTKPSKPPTHCYTSKIFQSIIEKKENFKNFTYVGRRILRKHSSALCLNIFTKVNLDDTIEVLLLDVSKTELTNGVKDFIIQSGQFLHDFKNPLLSITEEITELRGLNDNTYEFIYLNCGDNHQDQVDNYIYITEKFDFLLNMADYCKCMIGSYEDFSKSLFKPKDIRLSYKQVDLFELLNFIENMMILKITKKKKLINFIVNYEAVKNKFLITDDVKLKQILINILSNSEKFTSKGFISIECQEEITDGNRFIRFILSDSGIGMTKETLDKLTTPFYSGNENNTNIEGCGLGLLIVKEIINELGQGFVINSAHGTGTEITFSIEDRKKHATVNEIKDDDSQMTIVNNSFNLNLQSRSNLNEEVLSSCRSAVKTPLEKFRKLITVDKKLKESIISRKKLRKFSTVNFYQIDLNEEKTKIAKFINLTVESGQCFELTTPSTCHNSCKKKFKDNFKRSPFKQPTNSDKPNSPSRKLFGTLSKTPLIKPTFTHLFREFSKSKLNQSRSNPNKLIQLGLKEFRILVVDDYDVIRKSITKVLMKIEKDCKDYSFIVDEEDDGFKALIRIIQSSVYNNQHYDLIIMDEEMSYMNGTELYKLLKFMCDNEIGAKGSLDKSINEKILMCSADSKGVRNKIAIDDNMIVSKPITKSFLGEFISKILKLS